MKQFSAIFFDGKTAGSRPVNLQIEGSSGIRLIDSNSSQYFGFDEIVIGERLGDRPAVIDLPSGGRIEVPAADEMFADLPKTGRLDWVHWLESCWGWVVAAVAITVLVVWSGVIYGIPTAARVAAELVPEEFDDAIGRQGLELLDRGFLLATELGAQRRRQLTARFDEVVDTVGAGYTYRLEFRGGGDFGANALALPSGIIILTDELVEIAASDEEIAAVLSHEVGHVRHRHTLRAIMQNSAMAALLIAVTGDVGSAANIAVGIPTFMIERSYSRDFEREADEVAFQFLEIKGIQGQPLADLLLRVEEEYGSDGEASSLFSTHPPSRERY
jgi:Zn-dependent protease with chaperone function